MIRTSLVALLLWPALAGAKPWKPHPIHVIPGVPLKPDDIKPYVPPKLAPEPPLDPSDVKVVEVTTQDAVVAIRPWSSPMVGTVSLGGRVAVKGTVKPIHGNGCSKLWYALEPFGYICNRDAKPTDQPPSTESVLKVREGTRLPFQYVMILGVKDDEFMPMWATLDDLKKGSEPERQLKKGDTVAVDKIYKWDGEDYWIAVDGKVIKRKNAVLMGGGSSWHGIDITDKTPLPFGWITPEKASVYAAPPADKTAKPLKDFTIERRTRVSIVGEQLVGKRLYLKVTIADPPPPETFGEIFADAEKKRPKAPANPPTASATPGATPPAATVPSTATDAAGTPAPAAPAPPPELWVSADAVNEVRVLEHPKTVPADMQKWIDVDLGEQVLVLYENDKPVWATLTSSGRAIATPMGTYPVWAKVAAITMKNQPYEDKPYYVNKVPWSTFFQWHNAIHGAYWHDRFGVTKSHGCVNVAPLDAKHVFEFVTPPMPPGWTGLRPLDLLASPHVVVRNSHMKKQFRQDRPIGPPDKALESERLEEAEQRRAADAAATATGAPAPGTPAPPTPTIVPASAPGQEPPKP